MSELATEHRPVSLAFDRDGYPRTLCSCGEIIQVGTITGKMYFDQHVRSTDTQPVPAEPTPPVCEICERWRKSPCSQHKHSPDDCRCWKHLAPSSATPLDPTGGTP